MLNFENNCSSNASLIDPHFSHDPYHKQANLKEIKAFVCEGGRPEKLDMNKALADVMESCWASVLILRPPMINVATAIAQIETTMR